MEPLGLAVLAAATPPDVEVELIDDRLGPIDYAAPGDAVAINVETYTARRAYAIAASFRRRGVPVVLGGYHPTLAPDEATRHGDAIVVGSADGVWPTVVEDLRRHRLQPRYLGGPGPATGVPPRRAIFPAKGYLPITLIETGRGCRFGCDFCSVSQFFERTAFSRPAADVLAEIESAGRRSVFFVDDNIVAQPQRARELFDALHPAGIRWFSQASINIADDPALLRAAARSGCQGLLIGFESLSASTLASMGKGWALSARDYAEAVQRIRDAGIPIYATFVFGYDTDDPDAFERTVEFAIRQKFLMAAFNHLVPFPGTPLYARLAGERRLRQEAWWLAPGFRFGDVAFHPRTMTADELAERCYRARLAFYSAGSVLSRAWDFRCNVRNLRSAAMYAWLNVFSGREMRQRQGLPIGEGFVDDVQGGPT